MTDNQAISGLTCPRCGGMVPVPEGHAIVICPFCELRSVVRGEQGVRRYQLDCTIDRARAEEAYRKFLRSSFAIARDADDKAELRETFLAYLPFWTAWARALGWAFGEKRVGSGDNKRYEPREVRIVEELSWNGAACDVGEFGVTQVPLARQPMLPFQAEALHRAGLVFEPVGSPDQAREAAESQFTETVRQKGHLDRLSQLFTRLVRLRQGLVYYPLWVLRYLYRGRSFQVVVDGTSGEVLYGKAPGNTIYRAAVLVGGMLLGAILSVDVSAGLLYALSRSDDNGEGLLLAAGAAFVGGLGVMYGAYRKFRYGEQYELKRGGSSTGLGQVRDLVDRYGSSDKMIREVIRRTQQR